jgi:hypothetical protein
VVYDQTFRVSHHFGSNPNDPAGHDDFRVWVFAGDSTFTNWGDGGYSNWAFVGNDSDQTLTRRAPGARGIPTDFPYRVIHFPARAFSGISAGGGTPLNPGVPVTPRTPVTVPGISAGGGTPLNPGVPVTPGVPAQSGGTVHPQVKSGRSPLVTGTTAGSKVVAGDSTSGNSAWQLTPVDGGRYRITSAASGLVLTENTSNYFAETRPWTGSDTQKWQLVPAANGTFQIRITDQDCLTFDEDAKPLGVWTCNGDWSQQWKLQ